MPSRRPVQRRPVDWEAIRRRLELARRAVAGESQASPERVREVLDERARALARPPAPKSAGEGLEIITFALANEIYAIEARFVVEVFRLAQLAPLPGAEPPVCGATVWRGELLTILDLRGILGLPVTALDDLNRVIVVGDQRPAFGMLTDAVGELLTLATADVRPPRDGVAQNRDYIRGVTGEAVLVLDARKLLSVAEPHP